MGVMLKAESQFVGGVFLKKGINNITDEEFSKIEMDSWGKILLDNGMLTVIEMREEEKSVKIPKPKAKTKAKKGKK